MSSTNYNMAYHAPTLWGLMDCNNFYASCERIFRPDLWQRPIVVLSNNDGCIVARSAEAKALGIPMGEPEFKARAFLKKHNVAVFSSNYALYGDMSQRVMQTAESVIPSLEQYSIDEAFLRFPPAVQIQAIEAAQLMRERVLQWTGIAVSVGLAPTRTLAKLANHLAKKMQQGVYLFPTERSAQDAVLAKVSVQDVWGIGRKHAAKLTSYGIVNAKDLRDAHDDWLRQKLSVTGLRTALELRGLSCIDEELAPTPRHTLVSSRSFGQKVTSKEHLAEAICTFAVNAAARLRHEKLLTKGIAVHIRSSKHIKTLQSGMPYNKTLQVTFPEATDDSQYLLQSALHALENIYLEGVNYAKAGIMLFDLCPTHAFQTSLLSFMHTEKKVQNKKLMTALDSINARYGKHTLRYAGQGVDTKAPWRMRQKYLSPKVTTAWDSLPHAHCR